MEQTVITEENIDSYIQQADKPFIVDFSAIWSKPCLMYKAYLQKAMDALGDKAIWGTIDIDVSPQLAERFSIITIPTTLVFHNGQIIRQLIGLQDTEAFKKILEEIE